MNSPDTKEVADVHIVGRIDREIYKCITEDIVTDEVIITDERIEHIIDRRGKEFYEKYGDKFINIALRLVVSTDNPEYKNSIITAIGESMKRFRQRLRNNEPFYKKRIIVIE
ncbi:MAG TPA: hypothetical protein IAB97_08515 [Candidatus Choladousia intestinipullorum]|nr:hypothetical protein [Candidatus Choladousia intestinipullorum]